MQSNASAAAIDANIVESLHTLVNALQDSLNRLRGENTRLTEELRAALTEVNRLRNELLRS